MNLVGKIFVILNLVVSVVFMVLAVSTYNAHKNWFDEVNRPAPVTLSDGTTLPIGLTHQLAAERTKRQDAEVLAQKLMKDIAALEARMNQQVQNLQEDRERLNELYTVLANQEADLKTQTSNATGSVNATQQTITQQSEELATLREEIRRYQRESELSAAQVAQTQDQLNDALGQITLLQAENLRVGEEIARAKQLLSVNGIAWDAPLDDKPPKLDGLVLAASADGLVVISLGSDEGLRAGHLLDVFRPSNGQYLGRIEVTQTEPDRAVCRIIPEFKNGTILRNDRVATHLR